MSVRLPVFALLALYVSLLEMGAATARPSHASLALRGDLPAFAPLPGRILSHAAETRRCCVQMQEGDQRKLVRVVGAVVIKDGLVFMGQRPAHKVG